MTWAGQRRFVIGAIVIALLAALASVTLIATVYHAPSCSDNVQNQNEQGVDCGGPCARLCSSQVSDPVVRFTQAFPAGGATDVIAYVDNPNASATAYGVQYAITLYDASHVVAYSGITGVIDLPPGGTVPIFIPNIPVKGAVGTAFTALATTSTLWKSGADTRLLPQVGSPTIAGTSAAPRVNVVLSNASVEPIRNLRVITTLFDASGNVITASQTVVQTIPGQGSATATFNWVEPFASSVSRIDVVPVVPPAP